MIEFKNISKTFTNKNGPIKAINDITLKINKNEIFGIIGESGAGKSTLLRFVNALETPDQGEVIVDGINIHALEKNEMRKAKKNIGMIFQQFNLLGNKTVKENILLPLELHDYENPLDIDRVLDFVGLTDKKESYPRDLSGGQKQRVGIARGLITRPQILLCDEPTSALDENTKREIIALLAQASKEFDVTILIVTHELDVVKKLCERVAILDKGKLVDIVQVNQDDPLEDVEVSYSDLAREVLINE
jgi:D-methionine transport system ATP-binding protein